MLPSNLNKPSSTKSATSKAPVKATPKAVSVPKQIQPKHHSCSKHDKCIKGNLKVCKDVEIRGDLDVAKDANIHGNLNVDKDANIHGNLNVDKDANINGNLNVAKDADIGGNLHVHGDLQVDGKTNVDKLNGTTLRFENGQIDNLQTLNAELGCLKAFDCERWVNADYNRFKQGYLPKLNPVPGVPDTYEYENLSDLAIPETGDDWTTIVHGFIDFANASTVERLKYFVGAMNRLYRLVIDRPWSATEEPVKLGFIVGWFNTNFQPGIPPDQQANMAKAAGFIMQGLSQIQQEININPLLLDASQTVELLNNLTLCKVFIEAWNLGTFFTSNMGLDYSSISNQYNLSAYAPIFNWIPFLQLSVIIAFGLNTDPGYLLTWARAAPIMFRYFSTVVDQDIQRSQEGLKQGFYPHILRVNPYDSKGQSTFGEPGFNYEQYIVDEVQGGTFPPSANNFYTIAKNTLELVQGTTYEGQLSDDLLFAANVFTGGVNPQLILDTVVEGGFMTQTEADLILDMCRDLYYSSYVPGVTKLINYFYLDPTQLAVKALRLTRWDDYPGEWGLKFLVDSTYPDLVAANSGFPLVKANKVSNNDPVLISVLGDDVVIYDANTGNVDPVSLRDVVLARDDVYGEAQYKAAVQVVIGVEPDSAIPTFVKQDPMQPFDPITNPFKVVFITDPSLTVIEKIHDSGVQMVNYFAEQIDYYLNQWSIVKYGQPWADVFPDEAAAIAALTFDDRYIADLEDPTKGTYAFIQHYSPKSDDQGALYDVAQLEAYYTDSWDGIPQLKLITSGPNTGRIDGAPILDRDNNVLYDPLGPLVDGFIDITPLYNASIVDPDKQAFYANMSSVDIADGKSARWFYFNFDFVQRAYEQYITGGVNPTPDPIMPEFFSPYIVSQFAKKQAMTFFQFTTASSSFFNPTTDILTYTNLLDCGDVRTTSEGGQRSVYVHEWLMGHAMQVPLIQIIGSLGTSVWTNNLFGGATAEGWAVFVELYFCGRFTTYLSAADHYFNYLSNNGPQDPKTVVSQLLGASRIAARLKYDTAVHSSHYKMSMADYFRGFKIDTFGNFDANSEVAQRIPPTPEQGLNYALAYAQIAGYFESLPKPFPGGLPPYPANSGIGQAKYDALQASGHKAWKYFFDLILIDAQGYFLGSLQPLYDQLIFKISNGIAPFNDPNYDGYPLNAFPVNTVAYTPGDNPAAYEAETDPYVPGGWPFKFPDSATPL